MLDIFGACWVASKPETRLTVSCSKTYTGVKKKRIHPSLVELTTAALAGRQPGEADADEPVDQQSGHSGQLPAAAAAPALQAAAATSDAREAALTWGCRQSHL